MHKQFLHWVVIAMISLIAGLGIYRTYALDVTNWTTSTLSIQKQTDTTSLPPTLGGNGNIDCTMEDKLNCSVPTNYGVATSNSTVRLNSSGSFVPVNTYIEGRQRFFPVPNSDLAISYYSGPVYGLNLAFNYNFVASIIKTGGTYTITKPPDGKFADKAKHLLPADILSTSFSENGRWMVASIPDTAIARVNLQTFEVVPFAPGFNYTIGLDPSVKTAISNDGRYAVVASNNFLTFKIYDLSSCATAPDTITGPVACQSRDLRNLMQGAVQGFNFISQARFMDDNTLAVYASYKSGNSNKIARFLISDNGQLHQHDLLALGDSYISGEGAFDYMGGTDTSINKCHVSYLAYPYLIGKDLDYSSYHSVACSGAVTNDIVNTSGGYTGQFDRTERSERPGSQIDSILASFEPGYINQLEFVKIYQPQAVTVSIGGNDMGFSKILTSCVDPRNLQTCYSTYEDRVELIRQINTVVYPRLIHTYQQVKAIGPPDMRIYAIGYPQIAKPGGDCGLNVHLNADEVLFSEELINYLDTVIQDAAAKAGIYYVDIQDALYGFRLCEAGPGAIAMNGLTAGNDKPTRTGGPIGDESYHPNATGYQLLENKILALTHNLTASMPQPNPSIPLPAETSLEILDVPHTGRNINVTEYDPGIAPNLAFLQAPTSISIDAADHLVKPNSILTAELHSTPINLGSFQTDTAGNLLTQVTIPTTVLAGYHTLHFYGTDITGQPIDIYKNIYVAKSADDLDGDGALDSTQKCIGVAPAGQDFDRDGVDDACDADIAQPPTLDERSKQGGNLAQQLAATEVSAVVANPITVPNIDIYGDTTNYPLTTQAKPVVLSAAYARPFKAGFSKPAGNNSKIRDVIIGGLLISLGGLGLAIKRLGFGRF